MREQSLYQDTFDRIQVASRALIVTHQNPDGDAVGAALALAHFFERHQIAHQIFCKSEVPDSFSFLSGIEKINADPAVFNQDIYDLMLILDSGDLEYAGVVELLPALKSKPPIINIDHHPTNTYFGHLNLVEIDSASTTDIIFRLFDANRERINKEMATCLLCGIITDTGSFSNLATTSQAMASAAELLISGAKAKQIITNTLSNYSIPTLKLWGKALSRLSCNPGSKFVTTVITRQDIEESGGSERAVEGIANFLNFLDDAKVVMVLQEKAEGQIKGSLRTTHPDIDVSQLAKVLGGGGHKKAAGFTIQGRIEETEKGWRVI